MARRLAAGRPLQHKTPQADMIIAIRLAQHNLRCRRLFIVTVLYGLLSASSSGLAKHCFTPYCNLESARTQASSHIHTDGLNMDMPDFLFSLRRHWRNLRYRQPPPKSFTSTRDYCETRNLPFTIIAPEHTISRVPPPPAHDGCDWYFAKEENQTSPATFYAELPDMFVCTNGYVFSHDRVMLADVSNEIGSPPERHRLLRGGNLPSPRSVPGRLAVLDVSHGGNYFHFLFDCLPRLGLLPPDNQIDFYYVRHRKSFQRQYLQLLGVDPAKVIDAEQHPLIKAECLCLPSLPGISGNPSLASFNFLRRLKSESISEPGAEGSEQRIYISRRDAGSRLFPNESEIQTVLSNHNFRIVELGRMSVAEQIALFSQASVVVAPHGAGLSNLVFSPPGTRVLEMLSADYFNVCYWALCQLCGHQHSRITAPPAKRFNQLLRVGSQRGKSAIPTEQIESWLAAL